MDLIDILVRNWHPTIGDPSPMGWFTVVAYFSAAALLAWQMKGARVLYRQNVMMHQWILAVFAVIMILLGINKQLDLQTYLTDIGRDISKAQGWWENRRVVQVIVLGVIGIVGLLLGILILRARGLVQGHRLALLGFLFLIVFVVTRASSFFQMDRLINFRVLGFRMNWFLELTGIGIVALSAALAIRQASEIRRRESDSHRETEAGPR